MMTKASTIRQRKKQENITRKENNYFSTKSTASDSFLNFDLRPSDKMIKILRTGFLDLRPSEKLATPKMSLPFQTANWG
jgi:hypothetical protein